MQGKDWTVGDQPHPERAPTSFYFYYRVYQERLLLVTMRIGREVWREGKEVRTPPPQVEIDLRRHRLILIPFD